jgi:hypothetical protein
VTGESTEELSFNSVWELGGNFRQRSLNRKHSVGREQGESSDIFKYSVLEIVHVLFPRTMSQNPAHIQEQEN